MKEQKVFNYLALGDSYTIGEQVPEEENFPNQLWSILKKKYPGFRKPRIIAITGWTTDELSEGIRASGEKEAFLPKYDLVTLLIGVNNQYRGRPVSDYETEFQGLLLKAIAFAGDDLSKVVVLSIPDWGVTPFAEGRDRNKIAGEIDVYNAMNKKICAIIQD